MRLYHFANREFGLDDIRRRHLKADPFPVTQATGEGISKHCWTVWRCPHAAAFGETYADSRFYTSITSTPTVRHASRRRRSSVKRAKPWAVHMAR